MGANGNCWEQGAVYLSSRFRACKTKSAAVECPAHHGPSWPIIAHLPQFIDGRLPGEQPHQGKARPFTHSPTSNFSAPPASVKGSKGKRHKSEQRLPPRRLSTNGNPSQTFDVRYSVDRSRLCPCSFKMTLFPTSKANSVGCHPQGIFASGVTIVHHGNRAELSGS